MSNVQGPLVLLPVSGKGVLAHVDGGRLLHRVDQEIADCQWEEGGCVCVCGGFVVVYCYQENNYMQGCSHRVKYM